MTKSYAWEDLTALDKACTKELCEQSLLMYSRAMFRFQDGGKFDVNWHHYLVCDELEKVASGETENLIISIPPGGSKTHLVSICFPSWSFARNPANRTLMVSYSSELVGENSSRIRDIVTSEEYQSMWQLGLAKDTNSKTLWKVTNEKGKKVGEFKGASNNGAITGFRAGRLGHKEFCGALILDDPNKPVDMLTDKRRSNSNMVWEYTMSRMAHTSVPYVLIQQRLHNQDATGVKIESMRLLEDHGWYKIYQRGTGGRKWKHVTIPALITQEYVDSLPERYSSRVSGSLFGTDDKGRFSYWPSMITTNKLLEMEEESPYLFRAQYMQDPVKLGGNIMPPSVWRYTNMAMMPRMEYRFITADTAMKAKETSDYSVISIWGVANGNLYMIDYKRGKWESPRLRAEFIDVVDTHNDEENWPVERWGTLRMAVVEDAASGTGLIQELRTSLAVPIEAYRPNKLGKWASAQDTLPFLACDDPATVGRVFLNESMDVTGQKITDLVAEAAAFTADDSHAHDDIVDTIFSAVAVGLRRALVTGGGDTEDMGIFGEVDVFDF